MATERLSMRKIKEVLRHKWGLGLSHREVAQSVGVSVGAVWLVVHRAAGAGLDWVTAEGGKARIRGHTEQALSQFPSAGANEKLDGAGHPGGVPGTIRAVPRAQVATPGPSPFPSRAASSTPPMQIPRVSCLWASPVRSAIGRRVYAPSVGF